MMGMFENYDERDAFLGRLATLPEDELIDEYRDMLNTLIEAAEHGPVPQLDLSAVAAIEYMMGDIVGALVTAHRAPGEPLSDLLFRCVELGISPATLAGVFKQAAEKIGGVTS